MLRELSVAEQCHQAVLAVIEDDVEVTAVAEKHGVSRRAVHAWLSRYAEGPLSVLPGRRADGARDLASGLRRSRRILAECGPPEAVLTSPGTGRRSNNPSG